MFKKVVCHSRVIFQELPLEIKIHMRTLWPHWPPPQGLPRVILIEDLCKPIEAGRTMANVHQKRAGPSWMDSIVLFLKEDVLPTDKSKVDKIRRKALRFQLSEDQKLYKRSFSGPYL